MTPVGTASTRLETRDSPKRDQTHNLSYNPKYLDNLELKQLTLTLADDLYNGCPLDERGPGQVSASDSDWADKYITAAYRM